MTQVAEVKKPLGNPNFGKPKNNEIKIDHNKNYEFELLGTYELYKPTDNETGRKVDTIYPPYVMMPNSGSAYDEVNKRTRSWRFINTEKSIWKDEQPELSKDEEAQVLALGDNLLEFVNGKLTVSGKQENKINALLIQDCCENKSVKLRPTQSLYRLNNPEEMLNASLNSLDLEYEAMKKAQEATQEDMLDYAYVLGVNIEQDLRTVRRDFLMKAKSNPAFFLKHFNSEANKYKRLFYNAFQKNIISSTYGKNKLTWFESHELISDCKSDFNVVEELCRRMENGDKVIIQLYEKLQTMDF